MVDYIFITPFKIVSFSGKQKISDAGIIGKLTEIIKMW